MRTKWATRTVWNLPHSTPLGWKDSRSTSTVLNKAAKIERDLCIFDISWLKKTWLVLGDEPMNLLGLPFSI